MTLLHIWKDYSPRLFDKTHAMCLEEGFDSHLLCANWINNNTKLPIHFYSMYETDPKNFASSSLIDRFKRIINNFKVKANFERFTKNIVLKTKPNLIHFHFGHTALYLQRYIKEIPTPFVISFYGVDISAELQNPESIKSYKDILQKCKFAIVLCEEAKKRLLSLGCKQEKIITWNIPIDLEKYPIRKKKYDGCTRFLIAARFVEKKGHRYILHAFKSLLKSHPNVFLTIFGYGQSDWLIKLIESLNLQNKCKLLNNELSPDFQKTFYNLLLDHDIFLTPSVQAANGDDEGGPALTMVAAQSAGLPVIGTNFPGAEISLIHNKTGRVCDAKNIESLCEQMAYMCDNQNLWPQFGEAGSQIVNSQFSYVNQKIKLIKMYNEALD